MKELPIMQNVLIVGNGGRENALAWAIAKSNAIQNVFVAPGNGGTECQQGCKRLDIPVDNWALIVEKCHSLNIDLVVIGPEAPLAEGITDHLKDAGLLIFGPCSKGAQLEASKEWAKKLMHKNNIPTAKYWVAKSQEDALKIVDEVQQPLVVKADGLASGKGVSVCETVKETKKAIKDAFDGKFGNAGMKILLEEKLEGPEVSVFALCDGEKLVVLPPAQDHKRLLEQDMGPNTGGMGAYAPAPLINKAQLNHIKETILIPTLNGLNKEGIDYRGVIYAGLILTDSGAKVIEYNCRFGDPECQALMPLMSEDFVKILQACATGNLELAPELLIQNICSACIVASAYGYPDNPREGDEIKINLPLNKSIQLFHAGTSIDSNNRILTSGGRILSIVGQGETFDSAFELAYKELKNISFKGMYYRKDIGYQIREVKFNK